MQKFWIVNKINSSTSEILVYGYIGGDDINAGDFVRELKSIEKESENINIRINSGGGSIFEGFTIFNAIRNSKAHIETYVDGVAASMGTVIALAGKKVHMSKVARFMTHRASGIAFGNADAMRQNAELLEGLEKSICAIYAAKTGKTPEECRKVYLTNKDKWFNADEALEENLIDSIYDADPITVPKNVHDEKAIWNIYNSNFLNVFNIDEDTNSNTMTKSFLSPVMKTALGLGDSADQAAIDAAVNALSEKAAKVDALTNQVSEANAAKLKAENDLKTLQNSAKDAEVKTLLENALNVDKKITKEVSDKLEAQFAGKPDELKDLLSAMPAYTPITKKIGGNASGAADMAEMTFEQLDKSGRAEELKAKDLELFKTKFKECYGVDYKG